MTLLTMEVSLGRMKSFSRKLCLRVICKFMPKGLWHQSIFTLDAGIEKKKKSVRELRKKYSASSMLPISHCWEVNNQQYKRETEKENCKRLSK